VSRGQASGTSALSLGHSRDTPASSAGHGGGVRAGAGAGSGAGQGQVQGQGQGRGLQGRGGGWVGPGARGRPEVRGEEGPVVHLRLARGGSARGRPRSGRGAPAATPGESQRQVQARGQGEGAPVRGQWRATGESPGRGGREDGAGGAWGSPL